MLTGLVSSTQPRMLPPEEQVQVNVVIPGEAFEVSGMEVLVRLQTVSKSGVVARSGVGYTITVYVSAGPSQPLACGVIRYETVLLLDVELINRSFISVAGDSVLELFPETPGTGAVVQVKRVPFTKEERVIFVWVSLHWF